MADPLRSGGALPAGRASSLDRLRLYASQRAAAGPDHHFLINKFGVLFHEMRASDLVKIDLHGNVVEEGDRRAGA